MDYPQQGQNNPQDAGGQQPTEGAYTPGSYGPQSGFDAGQPEPGPYQPQSGYQAPPKKGGFNWLACCGIGCGVVLLLSLLVGVLVWKSCAPLIQMGQQMESVSNEVKASNPEQVRAEATWVASTDLQAQYSALSGGWIAVEGVVTGVDAMAGSSYSSGSFNSEDVTTYVLEGGVMVMDTTKSHSASVGDTIVAYGKAAEFDLGKIPFMKGILEQAAKEDPELAAMGGGRMIFVITQDVEKTAEAAADGGTADVDHGEPEPAAE